MKAGYKTTEFWMGVVAMLLTMVVASGALPEAGLVGKIVVGAVSVLASLGYSASRATVKSNAGVL